MEIRFCYVRKGAMKLGDIVRLKPPVSLYEERARFISVEEANEIGRLLNYVVNNQN